MTNCWFVLALLASIGIDSVSTVGAQNQQSVDHGFDCGTLSLYTLLRLEGARLDLSALAEALPASNSKGFTFRELREAAGANGVTVLGRHVPKGSATLNRPAIASLKVGQHEHYVVIRPIGRSGRLVQVIDAGIETEVLDYDALQSRPEWTGDILIPERADLVARFAAGVGVALGISALGIGIYQQMMRTRRSVIPLN